LFILRILRAQGEIENSYKQWSVAQGFCFAISASGIVIIINPPPTFLGLIKKWLKPDALHNQLHWITSCSARGVLGHFLQ